MIGICLILHRTQIQFNHYDNMQINFERFSSAINSLWRLKVFSDVQIFITNTYDNSIDLKIVVEEAPIINDINFKGCDKMKENNLLEKIDIKSLQRTSIGDIYKAKDIIISAYLEKNFHNADVKYELINTDNDYSKDLLFIIDEGNKIIVGVNKYKSNENKVAATQKIDQAAVQQQLNRLCELKESRSKDDVQKSLTVLKKTAAGDGNLMPLIIRAVIAHATLGEISDTLRSVFGEY